eukprot:scaffold100848_cov37-Cyclotella_meneghiniana.AAC.2
MNLFLTSLNLVIIKCLLSVNSFNTAPQSRTVVSRNFHEHKSAQFTRQSIISHIASLTDDDIDIQRQDEKPAGQVNIVLVTGFESFNRDLYKEAGKLLPRELDVNLKVYSDSDIRTSPDFSSSVQNAHIFIASLIFDYDDVVAVSKLMEYVKGPRLVFECATELMSCE